MERKIVLVSYSKQNLMGFPKASNKWQFADIMQQFERVYPYSPACVFLWALTIIQLPPTIFGFRGLPDQIGLPWFYQPYYVIPGGGNKKYYKNSIHWKYVLLWPKIFSSGALWLMSCNWPSIWHDLVLCDIEPKWSWIFFFQSPPQKHLKISFY